MNQEVTKYNQFDRFLNKEMSESEQDHFKAQLAKDEHLSQEFDEYKHLIGSVKELEKEQFRNQLIKRGDQFIQQEQINGNNISRATKIRSLWHSKNLQKIAAAACIILLMMPVSIYFYTYTTATNQLFNKYYNPYQNVVAATIRGSDKEKAIQESLQSYTAKNYEQAVSDIRNFINKNPDSKSDMGLYLGISFLETDNTEKAINTFQDVIRNGEQFEEQAKWYLAMTFLKKGETEKAKSQLNALAGDAESSYQDKAQEVLDKL